MRKIFYGLLFLLIDFEIGINGFVVDLLPEFVGCYWLLQGTQSLKEESRTFGGMKKLLGNLVAVFVIYWMADICRSAFKEVFWAVSAAVSLLILYIAYQIVIGVAELEKSRSRDMNSKELRNMWFASVVGTVGAIVFTYWSEVMTSLLGAVNLAANIIFLTFFYQTKKIYETAEPAIVSMERYTEDEKV